MNSGEAKSAVFGGEKGETGYCLSLPNVPALPVGIKFPYVLEVHSISPLQEKNAAEPGAIFPQLPDPTKISFKMRSWIRFSARGFLGGDHDERKNRKVDTFTLSGTQVETKSPIWQPVIGVAGGSSGRWKQEMILRGTILIEDVSQSVALNMLEVSGVLSVGSRSSWEGSCITRLI